jgi:gluconate 5-dehydrogenase
MSATLQQLFDLSGKSALITGASRGPGLVMARALGQAGARLMLCARRADGLEAACAGLQSQGLDARWVAADGALEADLQRLVSETLQRMGDVDVLVNAAGICSGAPASQRPLTAWDTVLDLNLRGYVWLSQLLVQHSMAGRGGSVIHVAPISGQGGDLFDMARLARASARAALCQVTRAQASAWGQHGIRVNLICPGSCQTAAGAEILAGDSPHPPAEAGPPCWPGDNQDLKGITLLLATAAGHNISGQCLALAGALSAPMKKQQQ